MEAYYKARQKKLSLLFTQMKKLRKTGRSEDLVKAKEVKKAYVDLLLEPPPARDKVMSEQTYLKEMKKSFHVANESLLSLKMDICYDLHKSLSDSFSEFNVLEKKAKTLQDVKSAIYLQLKEREKVQAETKKRQQEKYQGLSGSYLVLDREDQKKMYQDLEKLGSEMSNPHRKVIAYEIANNELEYRLTQIYEPFVPVKIK